MAATIEVGVNVFDPVTTSDTVDLPAFTSKNRLTDLVYVGVLGDVTAVLQNNVPVLFKAVPAGTHLRVAARRINATGTAATSLLAGYAI